MIAKFLQLLVILMLVMSSFTAVPPVMVAPGELSASNMIGQMGGPTQGIAVQGNYAYIGVGPRLVVVDISDPANPHQVGASGVLDDFVLGVAVSDAHVYVAAGGAGLQIFDITNPATPTIGGAWHSLGLAENVTLAGEIAYIANGPYGLRVLNVSNPAMPVEIAHAFEMNYVYDVAINGRYAYIAAAGAGLLIADISNPAYPVELGSYDTPGYAHAVAVANGLAYVADQWGGLKVVNVADPLHPSLFGTLQTQGWVFDVTLASSRAYIADAFNGLRVVNISDPAHLAEISGLEWGHSNAIGIVTAGNQAYLADRKNGLRVINVLDPTHPMQVGFFNQFDTARMVVTDSEYAYIAAGFNGVRILNINNPAHPVEVGAYEFTSYAEIVKVVGSRLYVCTNFGAGGGAEQGVHVVDISDPAHPVRISYYFEVGECRGIAVDGNLGIFADNSGLKILDFSDLSNPELVGDTQEWAGSIDLQGNLAYVAQISFGWKIYDITDPGNILTVANVPESSGWTQYVKVVGSLAYVRVGDGIRIYDVSNPAGPVFLSSYPVSAGKSGLLEVVGDRAYVTKSDLGFEVMDVSDPLHPASFDQVDTLGYVQALMVNGEHLYIADNNGGIQVYSPSISLSNLSQSYPTSKPEMALFDPLTLALTYRVRSPLPPPPIPAQQFESPDRLASTCLVTTTADSGTGSLRTCLQNQVNGDVITFSTAVFPPSSPATIFVLGELPYLDKGNVTLDASNAGVILDGSQMPSDHCCGIIIHSNGNVVQGLQVLHFPYLGIHLYGEYNLIGGSRLVGNGPVGQGNVFSDNFDTGIGFGKGNNIVKGNIIGLDASGTHPLGEQLTGMFVVAGNNIIGGLEPSENNIISANNIGIQCYGDSTIGNKIIGNYIGTDISGTQDLGNENGGIIAWFGSSNTLIQENVIVGTGYGDGSINLWDIGSDFNTVIGNIIGTDVTGTQPLPNKAGAVAVGWATYSRIGGTEPGEGNLVYGQSGIGIEGGLSAPNYVLGNQVGLNILGETNPDSGVGLSLSEAQRSIVGGATPAEGNSFLMDQNPAIATGSDYQTIVGNRIGVIDDGSPPLRAAIVDMWIEGKHNIVQANQVAFASERGIWLPGQMNTLRQNSIYNNALLGILLVDGGNNNLPAPAISLDASGGSGTTCPHCTVELFLDAGNQGRYYLDSVAADTDGAFSFPAHCPLPYPYLTATTTDLQGNTSEFISPHFSEPILVPWDCSTPNPLPVLNTLDPASLNGFDPTTLLAVTGSGFFLGSVVQFNGEALTTLYTGSSHLAAILPLGQITATGITNITVFNPAPGGGLSNSLLLEILVPVVTPTNTPSPSPTNTPSASPTATATQQPALTPTSTGTATPTPTATSSGTPSSTPSPTATSSATMTASPAPTQESPQVRIYLPLILNENSQASHSGSFFHGIKQLNKSKLFLQSDRER